MTLSMIFGAHIQGGIAGFVLVLVGAVAFLWPRKVALATFLLLQ